MSDFNESMKWKADEEQKTQNLATRPPECMLDLPSEQLNRMSLSDQEYKVANQELVDKDFVKLDFPRTMKMHVDPTINGQSIGLISFTPSKGATPDKQGCFGVMKVRGVFESERRADVWAENLIRNHDSYAEISYCWVGKPFPVMVDNEMYRASTREIDIRRKVDEVVRDDVKQKREVEKQEMETIQKRQRELMKSVEEDKEQHFDDLDFYVQLKTKRAHLRFTQDEMQRKLKESAELIEKVTSEIEKLNSEHPEYESQYLQKYTSALESAGIKLEDNPLIKYMQ